MTTNGKVTLTRVLMTVIGASLALLPFLISVPWLKASLFIVFFLFCLLCFLVERPANTVKAAGAPKEDFEAALKKLREEQKALIISEKMAALSKFASVASHELKNPLASLKNIAYFLTKTAKPDDEKGKRMLALMSTEIDRTDGMVTRLSEVSRSKRINKTLVNAAELVEETLASFTPETPIQITKQIETFEANVDPDKFRQVLMNLLTNARDAMPNGGQIALSLKKAGEFLELTVADTGAGMDQQTLAQIFEPMFTTKTKVLGMGLTVARELVETHKGTIDVQSQPGTGSTFKVTLPL